MFHLTQYPPVDYLVFGHITHDLTNNGSRLGGTAAYAALTAQILGLRVGIVTSWGADTQIPDPIKNIPIINYAGDNTTTFKNVQTKEGRFQFIHEVASNLSMNIVPDAWRNPSIVHLGPIAQEVDPTLVRNFPNSLIGVTPQGWMRKWNKQGKISPSEWPEATFVLHRAGAAVISIEDVDCDEDRIEELATYSRILAVTEAEEGARVYWNGDVRRFRAPYIPLIDDTGAGDIFAAAFFIRLYLTRDPWEAARFATLLSANSVSRHGLSGVPTIDEVEASTIEVF